MAARNAGSRDIRKHIMFGVLFAAAVYLGIRFIAGIVGVLLMFSLVALFVIVLNPFVGWLERRKIPRPVSASLLAIIVLGLLFLGGWLAIPVAVEEMRELVSRLPGYLKRAERLMSARSPTGEAPALAATASQINEMIYDRLGPIVSRIGSYTMNAAEVIAGGLVVLISTIYILASPRPIAEGLVRFMTPEQAERFASVMQRVSVQMRQWALAMLAGMVAVFILAWLLLGPILHVPFAFVLALIAGLFEIVPTIGPVISAIPPTLLALTVDPTKALWVVVGFIIIQQIEGHLLIPLILGRGVSLHPASVVFAVVVMGWLLGVIGIFLAVPLCAVVKTLVDEFYPARQEPEQQQVTEQVEQIVSGKPEEEEPKE